MTPQQQTALETLVGRALTGDEVTAIDFWQRQERGVIGHCHGAFLKEQKRYQSPPEQRL